MCLKIDLLGTPIVFVGDFTPQALVYIHTARG
jgi:hypothetical protein